MKKIACFFTGGYTESNSMISFLQKVNPEFQFSQLCPNRTKKRKSPNGKDLIDKVSGLTGTALIRYVCEYIQKYGANLSDISAVLIEDDLDGRFHEELVLGDASTVKSKRTANFNKYCSDTKMLIREKLGKGENFPVILMYASPEIEAWFVSDWKNSFGQIYGPKNFCVLSAPENEFFSTRFRIHVNKTVLLEYVDYVENYGYFNGAYKKLSDELIHSIESFKETLTSPKESSPYAVPILVNRNLYYSKKLHGDKMLSLLSPDAVYTKCPVYFQEAIDQLRQLI